MYSKNICKFNLRSPWLTKPIEFENLKLLFSVCIFSCVCVCLNITSTGTKQRDMHYYCNFSSCSFPLKYSSKQGLLVLGIQSFSTNDFRKSLWEIYIFVSFFFFLLLNFFCLAQKKISMLSLDFNHQTHHTLWVKGKRRCQQHLQSWGSILSQTETFHLKIRLLCCVCVQLYVNLVKEDEMLGIYYEVCFSHRTQ